MTNEEIESMYVSSIMRGMWQKNILWGKYYDLFANEGLEEFKAFLKTFVKVVAKKDFYLGEDFEMKSVIKGSHACNLVLKYIKDKHIAHHAL